jgi:hypothetical protein
MNYRLATIQAVKSYSADVTEIIDLDMVDPISQLLIQLDVVNVGDTPTAHAIACLTKIEVIDGSDVLFSLNGYEAEAVDIYHNKRMRSNFNAYLGTMSVQRFVAINFGRFLWDPLLAFDPKKFRNPQLKLSLDINAGGHAPVTNKLEVWANMFDQKTIEPIGFLMHKEIKSYTLTASGHEYTDLPQDYAYRKLFIRCQYPGYEPYVYVDNIKLSEDQDKRIIFNHAPATIERNISENNPMLEELIYFPVKTAATYFYCTPTARTIGSVNTWDTTTGAGEIAFYDGDGGKARAICATAAKNAQAKVAGWLPHATWEIPFGDQMDMADWYDVAKVGALKADIQASSSGTSSQSIQLFLQQLRRYGAAA